MKKKLKDEKIKNELKGASAFFRGASKQEKRKETNTRSKPPTGQSTSQSTNQLTSQPTNQLTSRPTDRKPVTGFDISPILGRPKSFYLTEKQDKDIDIAVDMLSKTLQGKVNQKIDRSTVIRLLLEVADVKSDKTIRQLADQLISRLVSQLTSQPTHPDEKPE